MTNPFDAGEAAPAPPLEDAPYAVHLRAPFEDARRTLSWMIVGYLVSGFTVATVAGGDMSFALVLAAIQLGLRRWSSASLRPAVHASVGLYALSLVIVALVDPTVLFVDLPVRVIMGVLIGRALLTSREI